MEGVPVVGGDEDDDGRNREPQMPEHLEAMAQASGRRARQVCRGAPYRPGGVEAGFAFGQYLDGEAASEQQSYVRAGERLLVDAVRDALFRRFCQLKPFRLSFSWDYAPVSKILEDTQEHLF